MSEDEPDERPRPRPPRHAAADADADADADAAPAEPQSDGSDDSPADARPRRPPPKHAGLIALVAGVLAVAIAVVLVVVLVQRGSGSSSASSTGSQTVASITDDAQAQAFVASATSEVAAVSSYSYRTLASDLVNGEAVTTGAYRTRFRAALTGSLGASARRLHRTQSFDIATAGIGAISDGGHSAHVLVFGTQNVKDDTTGSSTHQTLVTLDATMQRNGDNYLISNLTEGTNAGLPPGTPALDNAAEAAREEVTNLLTTRRAHVAADLAATLSLAVDPLRGQLQAQNASVRRAVTTGDYDLTGAVTAVAVGNAAGDSVTMLVAATGIRTTASGDRSLATDGRYQVSVVRVDGQWRVSAIDPVSVS